MKNMKIVVCTGGFDPVHSGHIAYLNSAAELGDRLVVGVNSDEWLVRKKGQAFMPISERRTIVGSLKSVDHTMAFDDSDNSACALLEELKRQYPYAEIIFANGGDRTAKNIPEMDVSGIQFVFGVGGENKANSSSWILAEWKAPKTERIWGYYRVLHELQGTKVKELTVNPGCSLSMQKHYKRAEYWLVSSGSCVVNASLDNGYALPPKTLDAHDSYQVPVAEWHQLTNPTEEPCKIVEIQYGEACEEEDIERR
jgi:cytidyltransferase-like protein